MKLLALPDGVGRLEDDGTVAVLGLPHRDLPALLRDGFVEDAARAPVVDRRPFEPTAACGSVVGAGASVWGIGMNYSSKAAATGREVPERPTLFLKPPAALAAGGPIVLPAGAPAHVDFEGEVAVVLDRVVHHATPESALAAVAGVVAADDVTARDVMRATGNPSLAKGFPGFGQFGSALLARPALEDRPELELSTHVDGELRQQDSTAGMLVGVGELLALLSGYVVLRPGDVVLTGTPAGTGDEDGRYLTAGSVVEVRVADLPPLRSEVVASASPTTEAGARG